MAQRDDLSIEYFEDESESLTQRKRTMSEKGLRYTLNTKAHKIAHWSRQIEKLENAMNIKLKDRFTEYEDIRQEYANWLELFEHILEERNACCIIIQNNEASQEEMNKITLIDTDIDTYLVFKGTVTKWLQDREDSRKVNAHLEEKSRRSHTHSHISRTSTYASHVSSARLKEEQKRAELKAKAAAFEKKQEIEKEKLRLKFKEEEHELQTEMAISDARWEVIDQWCEEQSAKLSHTSEHDGNLNELSDSLREGTSGQKINQVISSPKHVFYNPPRSRVESAPVKEKKEENDILTSQKMITSVVQQLRKPPIDMMTFKGSPLEYRKFLRQFKAKVLANTDDNDERLNYLEQFTDGEVKHIVQSYSYLDADDGYPAVMKELEDRYGDEAVIVNAFIDKALDWPIIRGDNSKQLDAYSVFLTECQHAVPSDILDYPEHIKRLMAKLPYQYQERFRNVIQNIKDTGRKVKFADFVKFVRKESKKANDPMFGKDAVQSKLKFGNSTLKSTKSQVTKSKLTLATDVMSKTSPSDSQQVKKHQSSSLVKHCVCCDDQNHAVSDCVQFVSLNIADRLKFVQDKGLCFRCLKPGHMSRVCRGNMTCTICRRRHNSLLHDERQGSEEASAVTSCIGTDMGVGEDGDTLCTMVIVPVKVMMKDGLQAVETFAFLDPGSSATFCTETLMTKLGASGRHMRINIDSMGKPCTMKTYAITGMQVCDLTCENKITLPKLFSVKQLPVSKTHIPTAEDVKCWPHLRDIQVPHLDAEIGLMIGNNVPDAYTPIELRTGPEKAPHASRTRLGWTLWNITRHVDRSGCKKPIKCSVNRTEVTAVQEADILKQLDCFVRQSFNTDFPERVINDERQYSQQDKVFLKRVKESIVLKDGQYEIGLPFKNIDVKMPNNYASALKRMNGTRRRLEQDSKYKGEYEAFMNKMFEKGYAEVVKDSEPEEVGQVWYIPHHGVYHPKKMKLRVVFNCAATYQGTSLNEQLLSGPDLTNNLLGVLLRFRQENYAAMGDIESMFYRVKVKDSHKNFQRFLWWKDGNYDGPPQKCRMTVHMFGTTSSPSCANAALLRTADENEQDYDPEIAQIVRNNFYVDDCLMTCSSEDKLIRQISQVTDMCQRGGFKLTKWTSSSAKVMSEIPPEHRAEKPQDIRLDHLKETSSHARKYGAAERALGIVWTFDTDTLGYKVQVKSKTATRRNILSVVSSIYDPLGLVSPFVLKAKLLLQKLCQQGLGWDEEVDGALLNIWNQWLTDLTHLEQVTVPRCYKPTCFGTLTCCELHIFSDASNDGYGVSSYLRFTSEDGTIHCCLLLAKARVTPLKKVTVPRLELTAACVSVRLSHAILKEVQFKIDSTIFWTDSMTVIRYIENETSRFKTFVANRLTVIHDGSDPRQWRYVPSSSNPADAASRGMRLLSLLQCDQWFHGPSFLWKPECEWPVKTRSNHSLDNDDPEIRKIATATYVNESISGMDRLMTYSSSWSKLKRVVGWYLLLTDNLKKKIKLKTDLLKDIPRSNLRRNKSKTEKETSHLTVEILQRSETAVIKYVQKQHFRDVLDVLTRHSQEPSTKIARQVRKLDPILVNGVIRIGGRLSQACIPYETRHPILLPKNSHVSRMIVQNCHEAIGHMGKATVMSELRQRFWILGVGSLVKSITSRCVLCRKYGARQQEQKMADLPIDRLSVDEPPFSRVGVDFFGPFVVKRGRSNVKRYGVVFTCLTLRAVHLEVASSLDTNSCINAFRRFFARRGHPQKIRSDNGTNLVGCEKELKEEIKKWNNEQFHQAFLQKNISWEFTPPSGSHHGGAWERMIRTIRKILYALLHSQVIHLDDDGLHTLLCEVEFIVNNRPLTAIPSDVNDLTPLTPNHLLIHQTCDNLPPGLFNANDCYALRKWRQVQYLSDMFWKRFSKEYLTMLQERQKWTRPRTNMAVNDIVLVMDNLPRNAWSLGRVLEVFPDKKGYVRVVKVKTQASTLVRPIDKLCVVKEADNADIEL